MDSVVPRQPSATSQRPDLATAPHASSATPLRLMCVIAGDGGGAGSWDGAKTDHLGAVPHAGILAVVAEQGRLPVWWMAMGGGRENNGRRAETRTGEGRAEEVDASR
ncbi:hypothetical protein OsI_33772 [Oryza sativa Indica Group]|uniref:Uncharacterized protein n=1 Tax=Oryza sativa subsp. indica TaxID=39946 RepID=B8BH36_ORYSI|nr:hypothetical protein OsI_33772 [Oryza sativa Indica Group]